MNLFLRVVTAVLSEAAVQHLILALLRRAAQSTDNTIDDTVVEIVEAGLANRVNPVKRVIGE